MSTIFGVRVLVVPRSTKVLFDVNGHALVS